MIFEEEYRKIIEQLKKNEDYVVMRTICENIIGLLKENGVKVDGVVLRDITSTETMRVVNGFEVQFRGLDFTEHDKKYVEKINDLKKQISELESELAVKEDLLKIAMKFNRTPEENVRLAGLFEDCEEEPLPFSCEEYADCLESKLEELRDRHQQDCITINQLHVTIDTLVDRYAKLREMRGL